MLTHLLFRSSLAPGYHRHTRRRLLGLGEDAQHQGLPGIEIMSDPVVRAMVAEFLGPGAVCDECRHLHWNRGTVDDDWHRDLYDEGPWPIHSRWAILFYYPQDAWPDMGPTEVMDDTIRPHLMTGPAGTCFLMRPDAWHRATANRTRRRRAMLRSHFRVPLL